MHRRRWDGGRSHSGNRGERARRGPCRARLDGYIHLPGYTFRCVDSADHKLSPASIDASCMLVPRFRTGTDHVGLRGSKAARLSLLQLWRRDAYRLSRL